MFHAESFIESINNAEHGTPRMEIMANAIAEADAAAAHYWRIYFRYEYIKESNFHEDNFKAIIMFPTLLQVFDEHPELEDDTYDDVMRAFKWVLENMPEYYQISREEIEKYYDEYERRCKQFGFSLRVYYMKKSKYYIPIDMETAKEAYRKFHGCKRDANSDCEACEINYDMKFALEMNDEEEALRIAAPVLEGRKRCAEVPHVTYGALTKYYLYHGNISEALYYGALCERYTCNEPEFLSETGYLLELCSAVDPARGWKIFKRNIENFVQCKNPMKRMNFARGAHRLLQCVAKETEFSDSVLLKPLPLKRSEEGYRVTDLVAYFYDLAKQQSELLDQRNGTAYYQNLLNTPLPEAKKDGEGEWEQSDSAEHGLTAKVSASLAAVPNPENIPELKALEQNLDKLPDSVELLSHSAEEKILYITMRFEGRIYEVYLLLLEVSQEISGRPCYGLTRETHAAMRSSKKHFLLQMDYSDNPALSLHLAMKLLHCLLPDMLGVIDVLAQKMYPANWVAFAGAFPSAVSAGDLFSLYISGAEDSDEVWMTTTGLCTLGLRELEMIGASRENFGYFADMLHYAGCRCAEDSMLGDAGEFLTELRVGGEEYALTWGAPAAVLETMPDSLAAKMERSFPSGVLRVMGEDGESCLPAVFAPMQQGGELELPNSHPNFVRRIFLAKETMPCLRRALELPLTQAVVRLEFTLSAEMRQKSGYSKELLWAEISGFDGDTLTAKLAETSELLPDCHEGDEITVTEENITGWMIRPENSQESFTEEDAFIFMQEDDV